jgi:hypothetical protein
MFRMLYLLYNTGSIIYMMLEVLFMKNILLFWDKRSSYEKAVLGLFAAFVLCCLTYFCARLYYGSKCDVCGQTLRDGEHYILDVRTGEILNIADYVDTESSAFWCSGVSHMPQEVSLEHRTGYMRFPRQAPVTARYCAGHTANLDSDFLVLSPEKDATICFAVLDGRTLDPAGRIMTKRLNESFDCWELEIQWDIIAPASPS